jgi:hypothetical protein
MQNQVLQSSFDQGRTAHHVGRTDNDGFGKSGSGHIIRE